MSVVAVGDFDPRRVEAMIRQRFGRIPARAGAPPRPLHGVPGHADTRFSVVTDREATGSSVDLVRTVPARLRRTRAAYGEGIVEMLYGSMLDQRLADLTQRPDAPFLNVSSFRGSLVRGLDAYYLSASVPDGRAAAGIAALVDSVSRVPLAAHADTTSSAPLLDRRPAPGRIVSTRAIPEIGVTEWRLSNGVRVVMKPTDFRRDEIILAGRSPGGTSLVPDARLRDAQAAAAAVSVGGIGRLSVIDLQRRLAGKAASVGTSVDDREETVSGYASPRDAETMFQLVYLYFTQPRRDSAAWQAYLQRGRTLLRDRGASPEGAYGDSLTAILTQHHPRARHFTAATFDSLSLDRALALYRERFADAGDFTFYLVGAFDPDSVRPLVEEYLGGLPSSGRKETFRDVGVRAPGGVVRAEVRRGVEPKSRTALVFSGPVQFDRRTVSVLRTLGDVLEIRLRERLREQTRDAGIRPPPGVARAEVRRGVVP
jgi:hypothetical protein